MLQPGTTTQPFYDNGIFHQPYGRTGFTQQVTPHIVGNPSKIIGAAIIATEGAPALEISIESNSFIQGDNIRVTGAFSQLDLRVIEVELDDDDKATLICAFYGSYNIEALKVGASVYKVEEYQYSTVTTGSTTRPYYTVNPPNYGAITISSTTAGTGGSGTVSQRSINPTENEQRFLREYERVRQERSTKKRTSGIFANWFQRH